MFSVFWGVCAVLILLGVGVVAITVAILVVYLLCVLVVGVIYLITWIALRGRARIR